MKSKDKNWIKIDEAVEIVMQRTGKTKRQARRAIMQFISAGKLPARSYDLETGDDLGPIPSEIWRKEQ